MKRSFLPAAIGSALMAFSAQAVEIELIQNGGFESGLASWSTTFNVTTSGNYFGLLPNSGSSMAVMPILATLDSALAQDVDPTGATSAKLAFALNLSALDTLPFFDPGTDKIVVSIAGTPIFEQSLNDAFGGGATGTGWVTHSGLDVDVGLLGLGSISFRIDVDNVPPGGDPGQFFVALVDDVSLKATFPDSGDPVPDAGWTVALLGAATLGLARFRK